MKNEVDDSNYEALISKLGKGSIDEKAQSLRKLLFLYENARSRIYLYERRITECLQLALLIQQKDICLNALSLLEKMIINTSSQSEIMVIIKKRLLSKMVLNLGSIEVTIRKVSHKCILQFLRKFKDLDTVTTIYLKTAIQQEDNNHLKLKAINSYHSLLMAEIKYFTHTLESSKPITEELIHASFQKDYADIRRAALICLIFLFRIKGAEQNIKTLSPQAESELFQLKYQSQQLSLLLESILRIGQQPQEGLQQNEDNAPSPKFISIQESMQMKDKPQSVGNILDRIDKIPELQLKIFNEVSFAEQFLKKLEKTGTWEINEIQEYAPFLEKCLVDDNIKLFSISKKIVEVIFNSEDGKKKQYYVVLVPCIVSGIGNKRFIVRKNLDKLVRQYIKNHTEVWVQNFVQRFAVSKNLKIKEILLDLVMHAYRTSPEFYYPPERPFEVFNLEITDQTSNLKRKVIDCILLIIEKQGKDEKTRDQMLQRFSSDPYNKILRKMGKPNPSIGQLSDEGEKLISLEPISPVVLKRQRKQRLVTQEPEKLIFLQKSVERKKTDNISEEKYPNRAVVQYSRERKVRNSHIEISFKVNKKQERRSKDEKEKTSVERLPELKKPKNTSVSKQELNESPVKRAMGQRNIIYVQKQNLKPLENPKAELEQALVDIKDSNWSIQFDGISKIRSVVQFHKELLTQEIIPLIVNELLSNLSNLRSGVTKLALMCLNEMMRRLHKRMYPFSDNIILTIIKKSITTSDFMQDEIKRCITTAIEELSLPKIIIALNSMKESRSIDIRMTFMLCIESMIRTQKIYRKETEWIWNMLVYFNDEPQFNLRSECKRLTKLILQLYKDWKKDMIDFRKDTLQRIDKLLKSISSKGENNLWIQIQNTQFQKVVLNKAINQKYFTANYPKFEELDKIYTAKKNWKDRMRLINELFQNAFQYPQEFEGNANVRKYFQIAIEQIDEKNPGLLINAINILIKSLDFFQIILEDFLGNILEKVTPVLQTRRGEITGIASKLLSKVYTLYNPNKIAKEYLRMLVGNSKNKNQIVNQLLILLRDNNEKGGEQQRSIREIPLDKNSVGMSQSCISSNCQNIFLKSLMKLICDKPGDLTGNWSGRIRELILACQRRFGQQFTNRLMGNPKVVELMS